MERITHLRGIIQDKGYNVLFNYDPRLGSHNYLGKDITATVKGDANISLITDERLNVPCIITDTEATTKYDVIANYTAFLAEYVNKHARDMQEHITLNAMRQLGFVLAFAAPTVFADSVAIYEQLLMKKGMPITKAKAFTPFSQYPLSYIDLWIPKMSVAELMGIADPSSVRSHHIARWLAEELKKGDCV